MKKIFGGFFFLIGWLALAMIGGEVDSKNFAVQMAAATSLLAIYVLCMFLVTRLLTQK